MPQESERLALEDIITIADNLMSAHVRLLGDAEATVTDILARVGESTPDMETEVQELAASTVEGIRSDWSAAKAHMEDTANQCNLALHTFVTRADFLIRGYENAVRRAHGIKSSAAQVRAARQTDESNEGSSE